MKIKIDSAKLFACPERPKIDEAVIRELYGLDDTDVLCYQYDVDGPFSRQFEQLYGILSAMIISVNPEARFPEYGVVAGHFSDSQLLHASFEQLKLMMEKVVHYLQQLFSVKPENEVRERENNDGLVSIRPYLSRIAVDLTVCGPGIFANFQQLVDELESRDNLLEWLAKIRGEIFEQLCREHCNLRHVRRGMEIHVGVLLRNYACGMGWSIYGNNTPGEDPFAMEQYTNVDAAVIEWFHAEFLGRYNFAHIMEWISAHIVFKINELMHTNLHILNRNEFIDRASVFLHEAGIGSADVFGFVHASTTTFRQEMVPLLVCRGLFNYFEIGDAALRNRVNAVCDEIREFLRVWPNHDECAPLFFNIADAVKKMANSGYEEVAHGLCAALFQISGWNLESGRNIVAMLNSGDEGQREAAVFLVQHLEQSANMKARAEVASSLITCFSQVGVEQAENPPLKAIDALMQSGEECKAVLTPVLMALCIESNDRNKNDAVSEVFKRWIGAEDEAVRASLARTILIVSNNEVALKHIESMLTEYAKSEADGDVAVGGIMFLAGRDSRLVRRAAATTIIECVRLNTAATLSVARQAFRQCVLAENPLATTTAKLMLRPSREAYRYITKQFIIDELEFCASADVENVRNFVVNIICGCAYGLDNAALARNTLKECIKSNNENAQNTALAVVMRLVGSDSRPAKKLVRDLLLSNFKAFFEIAEERARSFFVDVMMQCASADRQDARNFAYTVLCQSLKSFDRESIAARDALKACIVSNNERLKRFAKVVVNKFATSEVKGDQSLLICNARGYIRSEDAEENNAALWIVRELAEADSDLANGIVFSCLKSNDASSKNRVLESLASSDNPKVRTVLAEAMSGVFEYTDFADSLITFDANAQVRVVICDFASSANERIRETMAHAIRLGADRIGSVDEKLAVVISQNLTAIQRGLFKSYDPNVMLTIHAAILLCLESEVDSAIDFAANMLLGFREGYVTDNVKKGLAELLNEFAASDDRNEVRVVIKALSALLPSNGEEIDANCKEVVIGLLAKATTSANEELQAAAEQMTRRLSDDDFVLLSREVHPAAPQP